VDSHCERLDAISGWCAFNVDTMRMETSDFMAVLFNPVAQSKFVHTISAGYVTGSVFVLAVSAYFLLRGRHIEFAKRSMTVPQALDSHPRFLWSYWATSPDTPPVRTRK